MSDKVQGGTPKGGASLCLTCRNAQVVKGYNLEMLIHCDELSYATGIIKFPVYSCSKYDDKRYASRHDMEKIAWQVVSRTRGPVGFSNEGERDVSVVPPRPRTSPFQTEED